MICRWCGVPIHKLPGMGLYGDGNWVICRIPDELYGPLPFHEPIIESMEDLVTDLKKIEADLR